VIVSQSAPRTNPTFGLVAIFSVLMVVTGVLFYFYGRDVESGLQEQLVREELERSRTQTRQFAQQVTAALERSKFKDVIEGSRADVLDFKALADDLLRQNRFVAYVHLADERGETIMFKGPETIQKVVFGDKSVTFMERTTESMRYLKLDDSGFSDGIHDLATPLLSDDEAGKALGQLRVGFSQSRLSQYSAQAMARRNVHTGHYLVLAAIVFVGAFAGVRFHYWRIHRLEERLLDQSRLAYVGGLASGLVHELRNPINSINLNLSLLEDEVTDLGVERTGGLVRLLKRIKPGLAHLEKVSNEFLEFARPPEIRVETVDVNDVIAGVIELVAPTCAEAGVSCSVQADDGLGPVLLDRTRLHKVVLNLVVNAIQAMPGGGTLTVRTVRSGGTIEVVVNDTGMGMSDDAVRHLFTLFYTTKEGGVGLGLPIVKRLVQDLDGDIEVDSRKGEGTTFTARFPLLSAPPRTETEGNRSNGRDRLHSR